MKKLSTALIVFLICALSFAQPVITKIGTYKCGRQPKQVLFSPDSKFIVLPLLDDNGFDIFSVADKKVIQRINPPDAKKVGFAEGLFIPEKKNISCFADDNSKCLRIFLSWISVFTNYSY